jgi:hypothetical protein
VIYLANPSTVPVRAEITGYRLGAIITPRQGNRLPADGWYAIDNGCGPTKNGEPPGSRYPGDEAYLTVLQKLATAEGFDPCDPDTHRCLFAVAPDVVADAAATLARSYMLGWIDYCGFRPAFVAQNGQEHLPLPWDEFQVLFLGGSAECVPCGYIRPHTERDRERCPFCGRRLIEWKLGVAARQLVGEARERGKWVHMGRVNSLKRLLYAEAIGCDSADGTYLTNAPDQLLPKVLGWQRAVARQQELRGIYRQDTLWEAS